MADEQLWRVICVLGLVACLMYWHRLLDLKVGATPQAAPSDRHQWVRSGFEGMVCKLAVEALRRAGSRRRSALLQQRSWGARETVARKLQERPCQRLTSSGCKWGSRGDALALG